MSFVIHTFLHTRTNCEQRQIKWKQVDKWVARQGLKTTWKPYGMPEVLDLFSSQFADIDPMPKWDIPQKVMISTTITSKTTKLKDRNSTYC